MSSPIVALKMAWVPGSARSAPGLVKGDASPSPRGTGIVFPMVKLLLREWITDFVWLNKLIVAMALIFATG